MNYRVLWVVMGVLGSASSQDTPSAPVAKSPSKDVTPPTPLESSLQPLTTSSGQLAFGIEVLNSNIATLANQANDYAQITDQQLDTASMMTAQATGILVNSQIIDLQEQLAETEALVDELRARLDDSAVVCRGMDNCGECSGNTACVWCSAEKRCVAGDRNGPLGGECSAYTYGGCGGGCAEHSQCAACVADSRCGWCVNGGVCMEGSATDPGDCNANFWLFQGDQYGNTCPGTPGATSSYEPFNGDPFIDTQLSRLQRELRVNLERAAILRDQLTLLQSQLETVILQLGSADKTDIADVEMKNTLEGLSGIVDATAIANESDLIKKTTAIATEVGESVSKDTVTAVEASNKQRIDQEEQFMSTIQSVTENLAEQNAAQQKELESQKEANAELQEKQKDLQEEAAEIQPASAATSFMQVYSSFLPL